MRTSLTFLAAMALLLAASTVLTGDAARAGEDAAAAKGVWIYDVRVVRVDPSTREVAESPDAIPGLTGTTTKASWRECLAALKQRGATTILMDQNVTTLPGKKASAKRDRTVPILALNFANRNDEQKRASNVKTGCRLDVVPSGQVLDYSLAVRWSLAAAKPSDAPEQFVAEWSGAHPNLQGETLVLHYREQVEQGRSSRAIEIYGLVTGRLLRR